MPNWVKNVVTLGGDPKKVKELLDAIRGNVGGQESVIDFNRIIPMPDGLMDTVSPTRSEDEAKANIARFGARDWYDWAIANWGTKWNACDAMLLGANENIIEFSTAWSFPRPVFDRLAEMFPDMYIDVRYADEDFGSNCGELQYEHGEGSSLYEPEGDEAMEFALDLWDERDDWEKVDGEWKMKEE